jgi:hypothetical protein
MADVQIVETRELKVERTDDLKELNNEPVIMEAMERRVLLTGLVMRFN